MIAVIPARGGSRRIPQKNRKLFMGRPMMHWPIEAAQKAGLDVLVSTDDPEIARQAVGLGCATHLRLFDDGTRGTQEVAAEALRSINARAETDVCVIYPCSPMLGKMDLLRSLGVFHAIHRKRYVVSYLGDQDAGCFYWGISQDFGVRPLEGNTEPFQVDPARFIDINTPEDWEKAEAMYQKLHKETT